MAGEALHEEVAATLTRLTDRDGEFKSRLDKAVGYAVFPSVGRASAVLGGAYGRGEVFAHGEFIGFAAMGQVTVGVQVGGETFSEIVFFNSEDALDRFTRGKIAFTANASAVALRAAATTTASYERDVTARAYGRGGMLLELSLGGQAFRFRSPEISIERPKAEGVKEQKEGAHPEAKKAAASQPEVEPVPAEPEAGAEKSAASEPEAEPVSRAKHRLFDRATSGVRTASAKARLFMRSRRGEK